MSDVMTHKDVIPHKSDVIPHLKRMVANYQRLAVLSIDGKSRRRANEQKAKHLHRAINEILALRSSLEDHAAVADDVEAERRKAQMIPVERGAELIEVKSALRLAEREIRELRKERTSLMNKVRYRDAKIEDLKGLIEDLEAEHE